MATEKRLIDAMNTVTKLSKRVSALIQCGAHPTEVYNVVLDTIAEAPTVDAVEVVRCKVCKYFGKCSIYDIGNFYTDDFCAYGERRSDG